MANLFSFLFISVVSLILVSWYAASAFHSFLLNQIRTEMEDSAVLLRSQLNAQLEAGRFAEIDQLCKRLRGESSNRITIIAKDGIVLADSDAEISTMEPHNNRAEILTALSGSFGSANRFSNTLKRHMIYVAIPVMDHGEARWVIRMSRSLTQVDQSFRQIQFRIALAWFIVSLITGFMILNISRRITQPFGDFYRQIQRFARGERTDWRQDFSDPFPDEIGQLAEVVDTMALRLNERKGTILQQRQEEAIILSSMSEAVIAVGREGIIFKINSAAAELFHLDIEACHQKKFQEVIRHIELNRFLNHILTTEESASAELELFQPKHLYLQSHGNPLRDAAGNTKGAVIVLSDVTRLKKLEQIRKEFVANVTHELRTPITSIKGFVETLQEDGMEDREGATRFLAIIARQAERLHQIIEDLLNLSNIEGNPESIALSLKVQALHPSLEAALAACNAAAAHKEIPLSFNCPQDLKARIHPSLFEQAVINLVDNAIKYSGKGVPVTVEALTVENEIFIHVRDQGPGIAEHHLNRLFERFYRVDSSRSRAMGGTGLGLSIVKHICAAHGGRVAVQSTVGSGSVFTMMIPGLAHDGENESASIDEENP